MRQHRARALAAQEEDADGTAPLGVVDIGSQTTTLALFHAGGSSVRRAEQVRVALPLARHVSSGGTLSPEVVCETARVVEKLGRHARQRGCRELRCVATSAVRDAANAPEVLAEVAERSGLTPAILDGRAEAEAAALAVTRTLPVRDGFFFDLGGGSLQIGELRRGRCVRAESLPLGSLRLASRCPDEAPATPEDLRAVEAIVADALLSQPWFASAARLVGVGGTVRALAKLDRRATGWPIRHSHGYWLATEALDAAIEQLAALAPARRVTLGVTAHRARSILAGALAIRGLVRALGADGVRVCGFGVRDGVAWQVLGAAASTPPHRARPDWTRAELLAGQIHGGRARRRLLTEPLAGWYQEEVLVAAATLGVSDAREALRAADDAGWQRPPPRELARRKRG